MSIWYRLEKHLSSKNNPHRKRSKDFLNRGLSETSFKITDLKSLITCNACSTCPMDSDLSGG